MKRHLSILMLAARFTIYKVIGLLAVMSIVQVGLFGLTFSKDPTAALEVLLGGSSLGLVTVIGFVLLCILLCRSANGSGGAKSAYTINRLSVGELAFTGWFAVYNSLMFLLFWLWEVLTIFAICLLYLHWGPEEMIGPQTVFLACYRVVFLHQLIPLADISCWVRNGVFVLGLGICAAGYAYHERGERRGIAIWFMAATVLAGGSGILGSVNAADVTLTLWCVLVAVIAFGVVISKEREFDQGGDRWINGN